MKKLSSIQTNFAGAEVLSRAQLKRVMGGTGSDQTAEYFQCLQTCMAGWESSDHTEEENNAKTAGCDGICDN